MSPTDEPGAQDGTLEANLADLSEEFERIDGEKERLRRLADQLGLACPAADEVAATPEPAASPQSPLGEEAPGAEDLGETSSTPRGPHVRRPSLPLSARRERPPAPARARTAANERRFPTPLLESLSGFVPTAIFEEMKRERDELFFRLTKLEVERPQLEQLRGALASMEAEVQRLESEIERRRKGSLAEHPEAMRLCYRRWLALRRRRRLTFSDYLACRRAERKKS